uniref:Fibronectin type-III domain-containing protein n=1 Tax=Clytia hemisphaerica TaxID=252671 RepID=A0A7M5X861_9CNID
YILVMCNKCKCVIHIPYFTFFSLSAKNNYTLVRLVHHQNYQIFAQLGNGVDFGNSSNIITAKTDVSYRPPEDIKLQSANENDITLAIQLPLDDDYTTHLKFHITSNRDTESSVKILPLSTRGVYTLDDLKQLTEYTIKVATGNGKEFGRYGDEIKVTTKVRYNAPTLIAPINISYNQVKLKVVIPKYLVENKLASILKVTIRNEISVGVLPYPINGIETDIVLRDLKQGLRYQIHIATGDGRIFGENGKSVIFRTK